MEDCWKNLHLFCYPFLQIHTFICDGGLEVMSKKSPLKNRLIVTVT